MAYFLLGILLIHKGQEFNMKLGVIADDFTGAVDAAGFLKKGGMTPILLTGASHTDDKKIPSEFDVAILALKIRSCPVKEAVSQALAALSYLQKQGCNQFFYKYCSTFDSTPKGNIGPVTDAIMEKLQVHTTTICPALPVNGRTVYKNYLFVKDQLIENSPMRFHPITPMTQSSLRDLMAGQFTGKTNCIYLEDIEQGKDHTAALLKKLEQDGYNYIITDTVRDSDLATIAAATKNMPFLTGSSGLTEYIAQLYHKKKQTEKALYRMPGKNCVILSGSCSAMTNRQVNRYKVLGASLAVDIGKCLFSENYAQEVANWVLSTSGKEWAPLVYATKTPEEREKSSRQFGNYNIAEAIDCFFGKLTRILVDSGITTIITAGGETSGIVVQNAHTEFFRIGKEIAPGVSWIIGSNGQKQPIQLALKSGNFGDEDFFRKVQKGVIE